MLPSAHAQLYSGIYAQCDQKRDLVVVWSFGVGLPRGSSTYFYPKMAPYGLFVLNVPLNPNQPTFTLKTFFKGPSRLLVCLGVNRKRPLLLMIAP